MRLRKHNLFLKLEKCEFHKTTIQFLGYIISPDSIQMDQGKVHEISNWPRPQTIKERQCFLSFANFYHRFIQHFSHLTASLTSLLRKKHKSLSWNPEALTSFENLKQIFCLLHRSDPHSPRSSPPLCCGSGCFYHQGRSGVITVSRRASYPPSMRLLFEEAYPSRAEL